MSRAPFPVPEHLSSLRFQRLLGTSWRHRSAPRSEHLSTSPFDMALLPAAALCLEPGGNALAALGPSPSVKTGPAAAHATPRSGHAQPWAQQASRPRGGARIQAAASPAEDLHVPQRGGPNATTLLSENVSPSRLPPGPPGSLAPASWSLWHPLCRMRCCGPWMRALARDGSGSSGRWGAAGARLLGPGAHSPRS